MSTFKRLLENEIERLRASRKPTDQAGTNNRITSKIDQTHALIVLIEEEEKALRKKILDRLSEEYERLRKSLAEPMSDLDFNFAACRLDQAQKMRLMVLEVFEEENDEPKKEA